MRTDTATSKRGYFQWTEQAERRLRTLYAGPMTVQEIAAAMGLSRNTVIGKVHRLGLERPRLSRLSCAAIRASKGNAARVQIEGPLSQSTRKAVAAVVDAATEHMMTERLSDDPQEPVGCRYIDGDVKSRDWGYCQRPQREGSPYCAQHHRRCHASVQPLNAGQSPKTPDAILDEKAWQ